jgi:hypothetical protein
LPYTSCRAALQRFGSVNMRRSVSRGPMPGCTGLVCAQELCTQLGCLRGARNSLRIIGKRQPAPLHASERMNQERVETDVLLFRQWRASVPSAIRTYSNERGTTISTRRPPIWFRLVDCYSMIHIARLPARLRGRLSSILPLACR